MTTGRWAFSYDRERDYYEQRWPVAAKPYRHVSRYFDVWLNDPAGLFRGARVLDIGCGECLYTRYIADTFAVRGIIGLDLFSERMLPAARDNASDWLTFVAGDCLRLPFRDGAFEIVVGSLILHRFHDLDRPVREIRRVLQGGGIYVGIEPSPFNPLHVYRHLMGTHSRNEYLLRAAHLKVFEARGFRLRCHYFYPRLPFLHTRLLSSCLGIFAEKGA